MAGGQATNSGIDYQQRVSAWFLLNLYLETDVSVFFSGLNSESKISTIYFQTDTPIDDLKILLSNNKMLFFQIKRSLALSEIETSEFYKTLEQFIVEEINGKKIVKQYVLVTTTDASKKIRKDLKKITLSLQLNDQAFLENPLNESENDTLGKTKRLITSIFIKYGVKPSDESINAFLKKVSIKIIDIEGGQPIEKAALMGLVLSDLKLLN